MAALCHHLNLPSKDKLETFMYPPNYKFVLKKAYEEVAKYEKKTFQINPSL
jgi:hypothetical protein